jgi:hypothetical protein
MGVVVFHAKVLVAVVAMPTRKRRAGAANGNWLVVVVVVSSPVRLH